VRGDDTALARKAQQLAQRWLVHRSAIPPSARRTILMVAARTSDKDAGKLFDALLQIATQSNDLNEREDAHFALAAFPDPALLARALSLAVASNGAHNRYAIELAREALDDSATRLTTLTWLNAHADAIFASVPPELQAGLIASSGGACTARERSLFVALFEARAQNMDGGARRYRQALEKIDLCLALRRAQQQPFNAFLATAK